MNEEGVLAMSGYYFDNGSFLPFVWMFWDYPAQSFFKGKHQRVNFDFQSQIEGICHDKEGQFFISSESTLIRDGQLFRFDTNPWVR